MGIKTEGDLFEEIAERSLNDGVGQVGYWLCHAKCESPIERVMFVALYASFRFNNSWPFQAYRAGFEWLESAIPIGHIGLFPQAVIENYRVDFLLTYRAPDAKAIASVIECDGHDFHERTKEQAARDRSRDRALQSLGLPVYRFTGSEIWADPAKCASDAKLAFVTRCAE